MSAEEQAMMVTYQARKSLIDFAIATDPNYIDTWFHETMAVVFQSVLKRIEEGKDARIILTVPPRFGKQCASNTVVLTPDGYKKHGDLKVGDYVFGIDGKPVKVLNIIPQTQKATLKVTMTDGSHVVVHPNHEWTVYDRRKNTKNNLVTVETREMMRDVWIGEKGSRGGRARWQLPRIGMVCFNPQEVEVDPYTLGCWLGDGSKGKPCLTLNPEDVDEIISKIPYKVSTICVHKDTGVPTVYFSGSPGVAGELTKGLKSLGVYKNKFIPEKYLFNSENVRRELLAGLIDTDGYVGKDKRVRFSNTNKTLIDGVALLIRSLGYRVAISSQEAKLSSSGIQGRQRIYTVSFTPTDNKFYTHLSRKNKRIQCGVERRIAIKSIEEVDGEVGECIQVDSPDGLYLVTENFIPTHNSELATKKFPAWLLGKHPEWPIIVASYSADLAVEFGRGTREIMQSSAYQSIFDTRLKPDTQAKGNWMTEQGGGYLAAGAGGAITGKGFRVGIIDDIFKNREEADSETIRDSRWDWYRSTFYTRQEGHSAIIVIGTRWHMDDLIGRLLEKEKKDKANGEENYDQWTVIEFPAIATEDEEFRKKGESLWPEKFSIEKLRKTESALGPYEFCTPSETPILMSDWRTKKISEVQVGDEIIGFTQGGTKDGKRYNGRLVKSKVLAKNSLIDHVYDVTMESGRKVRCTKNHRWFTGRIEGAEATSTRKGRSSYAPINIRKKHGGSRLMFIEEPYEDNITNEEKVLWSYLAGIIDGEGHIANSGVYISQTTGRNTPVVNKIREVLQKLNIDFNESLPANKNLNWSKKIDFITRNPREVYRKLLRYTDLAKKKQVVNVMLKRSHKYIKEEDKVIDFVKGERELVYSLQTETGNYIAWGYGSSNSALYQCSPITSENQEFKETWFHKRSWAEVEALNTRKFATIDPGGKRPENDNTGIVRNYVDQQNKWNIKAMGVHFDSKELLEYIFRLHDEGFEKIGIEETVYLKAVEPFYKDACISRNKFPNIVPIKQPSVQKEVRIRGLIPRYSSGGIFHIDNECGDLEKELVVFPKGARDDIADALAMQNEIVEAPVNEYHQAILRVERQERAGRIAKKYGI